MKNTVTREAIETLRRSQQKAALSIYMPTHRAPTPPHVKEDRIRYKNLVRAGREALVNEGIDETDVQTIISMLEEKYEDDPFWMDNTEGLALFASPDEVTYFRLPLECDEHIHANTIFDLAPLLALLNYDKPYYLLVLATHVPKLYKGDMYGVSAEEITLPASPEEALNIDEMFANSRTQRGMSYSGAGTAVSHSHGQGDSREAGNEERLTYFRMIDAQVAKHIDNSLPVLLAGTSSDVTEFRGISTIKTLLDSFVSGNHTDTPPQDLHRLAWPAIDEEIGSRRRSLLVEVFSENPSKASLDMAAIREAALEGRIDTLMLGMWTLTRDGIGDSMRQRLKMIFPAGYGRRQTNEFAFAAADQGSTIAGLEWERMPNGEPITAIFRY